MKIGNLAKTQALIQKKKWTMTIDEESIKNILAKPSRAHELAAVWTLSSNSISYLWL